MSYFSETLREARKERGLSQEDLADMLNVSRQAVSKWELGDGYPEVEKLVLLSQQLSVSLDHLLIGKEKEKDTPSRQITGKIWIRSFDGKTLVNCYKVLSSPSFNAQGDYPKFALFGVDGQNFFGENTVTLGWYADEESIQKEVSHIIRALTEGQPSYQLQYAADVTVHWWGVKLKSPL